jgi:hypothetical protein
MFFSQVVHQKKHDDEVLKPPVNVASVRNSAKDLEHGKTVDDLISDVKSRFQSSTINKRNNIEPLGKFLNHQGTFQIVNANFEILSQKKNSAVKDKDVKQLKILVTIMEEFNAVCHKFYNFPMENPGPYVTSNFLSTCRNILGLCLHMDDTSKDLAVEAEGFSKEFIAMLDGYRGKNFEEYKEMIKSSMGRGLVEKMSFVSHVGGINGSDDTLNTLHRMVGQLGKAGYDGTIDDLISDKVHFSMCVNNLNIDAVKALSSVKGQAKRSVATFEKTLESCRSVYQKLGGKNGEEFYGGPVLQKARELKNGHLSSDKLEYIDKCVQLVEKEDAWDEGDNLDESAIRDLVENTKKLEEALEEANVKIQKVNVENRKGLSDEVDLLISEVEALDKSKIPEKTADVGLVSTQLAKLKEDLLMDYLQTDDNFTNTLVNKRDAVAGFNAAMEVANTHKSDEEKLSAAKNSFKSLKEQITGIYVQGTKISPAASKSLETWKNICSITGSGDYSVYIADETNEIKVLKDLHENGKGICKTFTDDSSLGKITNIVTQLSGISVEMAASRDKYKQLKKTAITKYNQSKQEFLDESSKRFSFLIEKIQILKSHQTKIDAAFKLAGKIDEFSKWKEIFQIMTHSASIETFTETDHEMSTALWTLREEHEKAIKTLLHRLADTDFFQYTKNNLEKIGEELEESALSDTRKEEADALKIKAKEAYGSLLDETMDFDDLKAQISKSLSDLTKIIKEFNDERLVTLKNGCTEELQNFIDFDENSREQLKFSAFAGKSTEMAEKHGKLTGLKQSISELKNLNASNPNDITAALEKLKSYKENNANLKKDLDDLKSEIIVAVKSKLTAKKDLIYFSITQIPGVDDKETKGIYDVCIKEINDKWNFLKSEPTWDNLDDIITKFDSLDFEVEIPIQSVTATLKGDFFKKTMQWKERLSDKFESLDADKSTHQGTYDEAKKKINDFVQIWMKGVCIASNEDFTEIEQAVNEAISKMSSPEPEESTQQVAVQEPSEEILQVTAALTGSGSGSSPVASSHIEPDVAAGFALSNPGAAASLGVMSSVVQQVENAESLDDACHALHNYITVMAAAFKFSTGHYKTHYKAAAEEEKKRLNAVMKGQVDEQLRFCKVLLNYLAEFQGSEVITCWNAVDLYKAAAENMARYIQENTEIQSDTHDYGYVCEQLSQSFSIEAIKNLLSSREIGNSLQNEDFRWWSTWNYTESLHRSLGAYLKVKDHTVDMHKHVLQQILHGLRHVNKMVKLRVSLEDNVLDEYLKTDAEMKEEYKNDLEIILEETFKMVKETAAKMKTNSDYETPFESIYKKLLNLHKIMTKHIIEEHSDLYALKIKEQSDAAALVGAGITVEQAVNLAAQSAAAVISAQPQVQENLVEKAKALMDKMKGSSDAGVLNEFMKTVLKGSIDDRDKIMKLAGPKSPLYNKLLFVKAVFNSASVSSISGDKTDRKFNKSSFQAVMFMASDPRFAAYFVNKPTPEIMPPATTNLLSKYYLGMKKFELRDTLAILRLPDADAIILAPAYAFYGFGVVKDKKQNTGFNINYIDYVISIDKKLKVTKDSVVQKLVYDQLKKVISDKSFLKGKKINIMAAVIRVYVFSLFFVPILNYSTRLEDPSDQSHHKADIEEGIFSLFREAAVDLVKIAMCWEPRDENGKVQINPGMKELSINICKVLQKLLSQKDRNLDSCEKCQKFMDETIKKEDGGFEFAKKMEKIEIDEDEDKNFASILGITELFWTRTAEKFASEFRANDGKSLTEKQFKEYKNRIEFKEFQRYAHTNCEITSSCDLDMHGEIPGSCVSGKDGKKLKRVKGKLFS